MKRISLLIVPALAVFIMISLVPSGADGAAIAIDDMIYTPEEPTVDDTIEISVAVVPVDAEIQEDGVVLIWSMCTETMCDLPNYETMTDNGDGTWSASITNMPKISSTGDPYVEVKFHVEVTADPTDGGSEEIVEENEIVLLKLKEATGPVDDDDDTDDDDTTDDDDDDTDDSPIGSGIIISSMLIASLALIFLRRRDH